MPKTQNTDAIKTRRLKKADFDVDFFFISGSGVSLSGKPEMVARILVETLKACQHFFGTFDVIADHAEPVGI
jgi:hypothetical protein